MNTFSPRRNPFRLAVSSATWTAVWYLLAYQVVGWVLFAVAAIGWCANVERARLRAAFGDSVEGRYREVTGAGVMARLRVCWRDPASWRDIACLLGMFVPLVTLDLAVLVVWLVFLAGITLPAWYWAPWQSVHGHRGYGLYLDTLPKARELLARPGPLHAFLPNAGDREPASADCSGGGSLGQRGGFPLGGDSGGLFGCSSAGQPDRARRAVGKLCD